MRKLSVDLVAIFSDPLFKEDFIPKLCAWKVTKNYEYKNPFDDPDNFLFYCWITWLWFDITVMVK